MNDQDLRIVWSSITISGFANTTCSLTLYGTMHRSTFAKVHQGLIGTIISAGFSGCSGGNAVVLRETLPWHLQYDSFLGALPNITGVDLLIVGMGFSVTAEGLTCLARTNEVERFNGVVILTRGVATSFIADQDATIDANDVGVGTLCDLMGTDMGFAGTAAVEDHTGSTFAYSLI